MAERFYRPELDALRFLAFLAVFCSHVPVYRGIFGRFHQAGAVGMCLFFVLSAYLIVTILLREREASGTIALKAFAARRILRIWPLYLLVLLSGYLCGRIWPVYFVPGHAIAAFLLLVGNVYLTFHPVAVANFIGPLWSISIEEQFYLVVPVLMRFGRRRHLIAFCSLGIALSYGALVWMGKHKSLPSPTIWINSLVQFQFFAAGGIIAVLNYRRSVRLSAALRCAMAFLAVMLWLVALGGFELGSGDPIRTRELVLGYGIALAGTVMFFLSILDARAVAPQWILSLGRISYGLYVFHGFWLWLLFDTVPIWPRMQIFLRHAAFAGTLAFVATVATAALSYRYIERPILKIKRRFETIDTRPA